MSDRRTYAERNAAMKKVLADLGDFELEGNVPSGEFDLLARRLHMKKVTRIFERYGFGEAWKITWTPGDPLFVTFTVENTDEPQFVLIRRSNRDVGWPGEAEYVWSVYTWLPGS